VSRLATWVRYRHPSDQAASADWDLLLPELVERALRASSRDALLMQLREDFAAIAPTLEISTSPRRTTAPTRGQGTHLTRWQRFGLGDEFYVQWREGRDPDRASIWLTMPLDFDRRCKTAQLRAKVHREGGGVATVSMMALQPELASKEVDRKVLPTDGDIAIAFEIPADTYQLSLAVSLEGAASLQTHDASLGCDQQAPHSVDLANASWEALVTPSMYERRILMRDGHPSFDVHRLPVDTKLSEADYVDTALGDGIWAHLPLAVWTDGARTFPVVATPAPHVPRTPTDLAVRLAAVASAWGTLRIFFPYFPETRVDWNAELRPALARAGEAHTLAEIRFALLSLLAKLRDNHVRVTHPALSLDGLLPVKLRRFGDHVFVVGTLADHAAQVPLGAEVLSIDHKPVLQAYDELVSLVPAATPNWAGYMIPYWLTLGSSNSLGNLQLATPTGERREVTLPRVSRETYAVDLHEPRPVSEQEIEPGIVYIDAAQLRSTNLPTLLPLLMRARAVIVDGRGYPVDRSAIELLAHFTDRPLKSPIFQIPHIGTNRFEISHWEARPALPRSRASLFVLIDGRAASAGETLLQFVHDNHVGLLIGESSGGTNGDVEYSTLPGGFSIRFTGARTLFPDGSLVQGHGIPPDVVVHPTAEAMRAGRDEILEEALRRARAAKP